MDTSIKKSLEEFVSKSNKLLDNRIISAYCFGSAVYEDFHRGYSDLDFFMIIDGTITEEQKEDILEQMQDCNGERQGIGRQFGLKMGQRNGNGGCQGRFGTNQ